ncbi:MAG: DNA primase [Coriobacteriia bacterium]|nr:DNA primase [Coriobacteriia bacterium]
MGRIPDDDVRRVREATDLVATISERVVLKQKGRLFWGCCPFHAEKTPSFKVDPATQLWHCFGCGLGGDVFGFLMKAENAEFADTVRMLADRAHIEIVEESGGAPRGQRERLMAASEAAADFYHDMLTKSRDAESQGARQYLATRGFGSDVAKVWKLGYAPGRAALSTHLASAGFSAEEITEANLGMKGDNGRMRDRFYERLMFPIGDLQGRIIAFGGRVLGSGEPKYLNTQDTPVFHKSANMYGIDRAKTHITSTGTAIVVEGYTDVIAMHQAGFPNTVATLGTALTREHVRLLSRFAKRVVYLFDGDAAGLRAADRAVEFVGRDSTMEAGSSRIDLFAAVIPEGMDPADLVSKKGPEAVRDLVADATPLLRFGIDRRLARWDLDRPEQRERALGDAVQLLVPIRESETAREYARYIAGRLFTEPAIVIGRMASMKVNPSQQDEGAQASKGTTPFGGLSLTREVQVEYELLALLVRKPSLRSRAQFLLTENLLSDPTSRQIAEVLMHALPQASAVELIGTLEERFPHAVEAISGSSLLVDDSEVDAVEHDLAVKLKEFELERRIAEGKGRLRQPESFKEKADYDEMFKKVSALQSELDEYRRGARDVG